MKNRRAKVAPGQLRLSQLVTTYGPGAPVDLPNRSALVGGLEGWHPPGDVIAERRLIAKIRGLFPQLGDFYLRRPPAVSNDPAETTGVQTWLFPDWFLTVNAERRKDGVGRSRRLVHRAHLTRWRFIDDDRKKHEVVPVRFVRACIRGHIDDIDWYNFVHQGDEDCRRPLWFDERGTSGDVNEIIVRCECGKSRPISAAAIKGTAILGKCGGNRPWLGSYSREGCDQTMRLLVRTASNAYFTQVMSVISLPDQDEEVQKAIEPIWEDFLEDLESIDEFRRVRTKKQKVKSALEGFDDDTAWNAIQARLHGTVTDKSVKQVEFEVLAASQPEIGEDRPDGDFYARALRPDQLVGKHVGALDKVVLVHRLREVQALVGFTRFEALSPDTNGELEAGVQRAALARETKWFPAIESRGEGIFLLFNRKTIDEWAQKAAVQQRARQLMAGFAAWKEGRKHSKREFCGVDYMLLHSLSHLLITAVSLGCGYPSSSIRERVYALGDLGYGILLYTASSDAEGTLGGLVEVGRRIGTYLDEALEMGRLCSNDPVCAQHDPKDTHEQRFLHGASCHGCLLISETSCEQRNDFLDRALVVPTVDGNRAAFFTLDES